MTGVLLSLESRWDWRASARFRIASVVSLWLVIGLVGVASAVLIPLAAVRTAASFAQTVLNIRLGKKFPVEKQTKFDWWLVAGIFAGAELAAVAANVTGNMQSTWLYLPMLVPFTILQWRMTTRSYVAFEQQRAAKVVSFRLNEYQRAEAA